MDIFEYWAVLRREAKLFWGVVLAVVIATLVWQVMQKPVFEGVLLLNIGRTAPTTGEDRASSEYAYDNFYRLQADERFGDTVVRWLENPRVVSDIYNDAKMSSDTLSQKALAGAFDARRLSSQVVEVHFRGATSVQVEDMAEALVRVTNRYTETLNQSNESWFRVVGSEPVIRDARIALLPALLVALVGGMFLAFWAVLVYDYWQTRTQKKSSVNSQVHS